MGQYWYILNLDKRQYISCGKFGEFYFKDGVGYMLTQLLQRRYTLPLDPLPDGSVRLKGLKVVQENAEGNRAALSKIHRQIFGGDHDGPIPR